MGMGSDRDGPCKNNDTESLLQCTTTCVRTAHYSDQIKVSGTVDIIRLKDVSTFDL